MLNNIAAEMVITEIKDFGIENSLLDSKEYRVLIQNNKESIEIVCNKEEDSEIYNAIHELNTLITKKIAGDVKESVYNTLKKMGGNISKEEFEKEFNSLLKEKQKELTDSNIPMGESIKKGFDIFTGKE